MAALAHLGTFLQVPHFPNHQAVKAGSNGMDQKPNPADSSLAPAAQVEWAVSKARPVASLAPHALVLQEALALVLQADSLVRVNSKVSQANFQAVQAARVNLVKGNSKADSNSSQSLVQAAQVVQADLAVKVRARVNLVQVVQVVQVARVRVSLAVNKASSSPRFLRKCLPR